MLRHKIKEEQVPLCTNKDAFNYLGRKKCIRLNNFFFFFHIS